MEKVITNYSKLHLLMHFIWTIILTTIILTIVYFFIKNGLNRLFQAIVNIHHQELLDLFAVLPPSKLSESVVFIGDSLVEFFPIREFFPDIPILNRGIGGNTTTDVLNRLDTSIYNLKPARVFLWIGTNDLARNPFKINEIVANIELIINKIQKNLPETKIYLLSIPPIRSPTKAKFIKKVILKKRTNEKIQEMNQLIKNMCIAHNIQYIELFPFLTDEKGELKEQYTLEGLHLSAKAYLIVAEKIKPYLEDILPTCP